MLSVACEASIVELARVSHLPHTLSTLSPTLVQEGRGVSVYSHRFSGSGHCEHYRRHPHDYALQLSSFVSKALGAW